MGCCYVQTFVTLLMHSGTMFWKERRPDLCCEVHFWYFSIIIIIIIIILSWLDTPSAPRATLSSSTTTLRHTALRGIPLDKWSARLFDNTQHTPETYIHAPGEIRTRNPNYRATVDPSFRPSGHWDRLLLLSVYLHCTWFIDKYTCKIVHFTRTLINYSFCVLRFVLLHVDQILPQLPAPHKRLSCPAVHRLCNPTDLSSIEYVRLLGGKANQSLPSGIEANNAWSFTSTLSHVWYLIKCKDNFTFILDICCYQLLSHKLFRTVAMLFLVSQTYCSL
jgi:hypothetical protein